MTKKELRDIMNDYNNVYGNIDYYNYIVVDKKSKQLLENCNDINLAIEFINIAIEFNDYKKTENDYIIYNLNDYKDNDILDINEVLLW